MSWATRIAAGEIPAKPSRGWRRHERHRKAAERKAARFNPNAGRQPALASKTAPQQLKPSQSVASQQRPATTRPVCDWQCGHCYFWNSRKDCLCWHCHAPYSGN